MINPKIIKSAIIAGCAGLILSVVSRNVGLSEADHWRLFIPMSIIIGMMV